MNTRPGTSGLRKRVPLERNEQKDVSADDKVNPILSLRRTYAVAAASVVAILGLSGCGSEAAPESAASSETATGQEAEATTVATAETTPGTVGIVEFDTTSPIDSLFVTGTRNALEEQGWEVLSQDPQGDPGQANTICAQHVTSEVEAIVVTVFAVDQMAQCMSQAAAAEIPVFYIGSPLMEGMAGAVDVTSPAPINDLFLEYVEENDVTDVLTLDYTPGTPCRVRAEYRDERLADRDVEVSNHEFPIPGQVVDARNATSAWLAANPADSGELAVWSCFTDPTTGALAALNELSRQDIPVFTWDFNESILQPLKDGHVAATLSLDGEAVGAQVAGLVDDYLEGGEPQGVPAESTVLTAENIDQFLEENPGALD